MGVFIILWLQGYIIIIRGGKRSQGLKKKCNQKCNQIIFFGYKVTNEPFLPNPLPCGLTVWRHVVGWG